MALGIASIRTAKRPLEVAEDPHFVVMTWGFIWPVEGSISGALDGVNGSLHLFDIAVIDVRMDTAGTTGKAPAVRPSQVSLPLMRFWTSYDAHQVRTAQI